MFPEVIIIDVSGFLVALAGVGLIFVNLFLMIIAILVIRHSRARLAAAEARKPYHYIQMNRSSEEPETSYMEALPRK